MILENNCIVDVGNNYIIDVEIDCVKSLFRRRSISYSYYMHNSHVFMDNNGPFVFFELIKMYFPDRVML